MSWRRHRYDRHVAEHEIPPLRREFYAAVLIAIGIVYLSAIFCAGFSGIAHGGLPLVLIGLIACPVLFRVGIAAARYRREPPSKA